MLSVKEKILLLDEVANSARSSWQIYLVGYNDFGDWPIKDRSDPAYLGYSSLRNLLSISLMTACNSLIETGKRAYSFHHAVTDPVLDISPITKEHCEKCFVLRSKISTYRNNVVAHVNSKKTQAEWAQAAGIKNKDIDAFLQNAKTVISELAKDNLEEGFVPSITMPVRTHFHEYCRMTAQLAHERRMAIKGKV